MSSTPSLVLTASISSIGWNYTLSYPWGESNSPGTFSDTDSFLDANGNSTVDVPYIEQNTLAGGASQTLTLSSLLDLFNNSIAFSLVNIIYLQVIENTATPNAGIKLGGATTHPFGAGTLFDAGTDTLTVRNGGHIYIVASDATGYPVVSGTSDQLLLTNTDSVNSVSYNLTIIGHS